MEVKMFVDGKAWGEWKISEDKVDESLGRIEELMDELSEEE